MTCYVPVSQLFSGHRDRWETGRVRSAITAELSEAIATMASEGMTVRTIARELGLSRSAVHRDLSRRAVAGEWDGGTDPWTEDDDESELPVDDVEAVPPFRFVGSETVWTQLPGDDVATRQVVDRWLDGNGRSVNLLDIWRADYGDGSVPRGYMDAAMMSAGYHREDDGTYSGRWTRD